VHHTFLPVRRQRAGWHDAPASQEKSARQQAAAANLLRNGVTISMFTVIIETVNIRTSHAKNLFNILL